MEKMRTITNRTDIEVPFEYRREFEVPADCRGQELIDKIKEICGLDWKYVEFTDLNFSGTALTHVSFSGAKLKGVDFADATLTHVDFSGTAPTHVSFSGTALTHVSFSGAKLEGVDFADATLTHVYFRDATLTHVCFADAKLTKTDFTDVKMDDDVGFYGATLTGAKNVNFSGTRYPCFAKHARVIKIPEITWDEKPIAAVMPEGPQPLLISIGCRTHTPEEWAAFTTDQLRRMDENAVAWYDAHMEVSIKKAYELEAEWRENDNHK